MGRILPRSRRCAGIGEDIVRFGTVKTVPYGCERWAFGMAATRFRRSHAALGKAVSSRLIPPSPVSLPIKRGFVIFTWIPP